MFTLVIFSFLSFALFLGFSVAIHLQPAATLTWGFPLWVTGVVVPTHNRPVNNIKDKSPQLVLALRHDSYRKRRSVIVLVGQNNTYFSKTKINIGNNESGHLRNCSIHI